MNKKKKLNEKLPVFPIGTFSEALGVHQRTLRIYDKEGILVSKRTQKNRRYYNLADLERAKLILYLTRNLALNLSGVKIILALLDNNKIKDEDKLEYIKNLAKLAKISKQEQETNILKTAKRGRKINS